MASPRSVRLDDSVLERLLSFTLRNPGLTASSAMALLLDEGLRMSEFPGIIFRDGGAGRRAGLVAGPDVWEVVRAVRGYAQSADRKLVPDVIRQIADAFNLSEPAISVALDYYGCFPVEIDEWIREAELLEARLARQGDAVRDLLGA